MCKKPESGDGIIAIKQYRFKLQTVLDYRTEQLNLMQQKVAEAEFEKLKIEQRIQEYDEAIQQSFVQQKTLNEGPLNPGALQSFPAYVWRMKQARFQVFQTLQAQEQKLRDLRALLQQALIKKKALDTLKEKDETKYKKALEKAEEEFLAELALTRAIRQEKALSH